MRFLPSFLAGLPGEERQQQRQLLLHEEEEEAEVFLI